MKIMKPIASDQMPTNAEQYFYEIKYDGFRALLVWGKSKIQIISRNNVDLTNNFPEIIKFCKQAHEKVADYLPITLDGELVVLNNEYEANFSLIQWRGRLKSGEKITAAANDRSASFLAFDMLRQNNKDLTGQAYEQRKKSLQLVIKTIANEHDRHILQIVSAFENKGTLRKIISDYRCEGIVAKRKNSKYVNGKRHHDWFKVKNWRTIHCFLTFYNPSNGYFSVCVFQNEKIMQIGKCKHGLSEGELDTVTKLFVENGHKVDEGYELPPAICAEIHTLDLYDRELREPKFVHLLPNSKAEECTYEQMRIDLAMMPQSVDLSNTEKIFWPNVPLTKGDLLIYLRLISPYMMPFLRDKVLTVIRCPDGIDEEFFYQKSLPTYAPDFLRNVHAKEIICNEVEALIWLANHGAIEYHVPFQTTEHTHPAEIVFDLDPPNREKFQLAVDAALLIKRLIDNLELISFVKTSGNKGLQIHIPLPDKAMTYDETAIFTEAIATTLVTEHPSIFTIERLKKNRHDRLYIDYVQHGKGKTIIAPYSPRKTTDATVATPLFWDELSNKLTPSSFTITNIVERVRTYGCPFSDYKKAGQNQIIERLLKHIRT